MMTDLRQAIRSLVHTPGFTIPLLLVVSLGLGTAVALLGILQRVLLRPLSVSRPQELVTIKDVHLFPNGNFGSFLQFQELSQAIPDVPMAASTTRTLAVAELPVRPLRTARFVTPGFFTALGLHAQLGQLQLEGEEPTAVLSHAFWMEAFQGDPGILGRSLLFQNQLCRVVGVGPRAFTGLQFGLTDDVWFPMASYPRFEGDPASREQALTSRSFSLVDVLARLKPERAESFKKDLEAVAHRFAQTYPNTDGKLQWRAVPTEADRNQYLDDVLPDRSLIFGASLLGLLLTAVGAASLMGARSERRRQELLLRGALGADGWELARPLLAETTVLAAIALPLAVSVGWLLGEHLLALPQNAYVEPVPLHTDLGGSVLFMAVGLLLLVLGTSVIAPVVQCLRLDLVSALRQGTAQAGRAGRGHLLVSLQVGLSLALLAATSVAFDALRKGAQVGYSLSHKAILQVNTHMAGEAEDKGLPDRLLARAKALPGIESAALGAAVPMDAMISTFVVRDQLGEEHRFPGSFVGADWFQTLGVPILEGREFRESDTKQAVILSASMAKQVFPGVASVVGRRLPSTHLEVVGVVADHRQRVDKDLHQPNLFLTRGIFTSGQTTLLVRSSGDAQALPSLLRQVLTQEAPGLPPMRTLTLEDQLDRVLRQERQNLRVLGLLGFGSLALACFGLWAALNLQVAMRWRELGIRAALGATLRQLLAAVMIRGLKLLALGVSMGLALTWILMRLGRWRWPRMPEISAWDVCFAALALLAAGLLACLIPAFRAARVNPAEALRSE